MRTGLRCFPCFLLLLRCKLPHRIFKTLSNCFSPMRELFCAPKASRITEQITGFTMQYNVILTFIRHRPNVMDDVWTLKQRCVRTDGRIILLFEYSNSFLILFFSLSWQTCERKRQSREALSRCQSGYLQHRGPRR